MKKIISTILVLGMMVAMVGCSAPAESASKDDGGSSYPNKPINVIVAYKAGGGTDTGARILTSVAEEEFGQPLLVVNKEGADGEIGYTELAMAKPDGYTIGFINLPTFVSLPNERETNYSPDDVIPLVNHVYDQGVLVVQGSSEWQTLEQFVQYAKDNPEAITVSNNGTGASNHIGGAHFAKEAGIKLSYIPFGGSADMLAALRGGHVKATVAKISEVTSLVNAGELRILASFTEERLESFPEVPTLKEKGYDVIFGSARGIVAPKGTPDEIVKILREKLEKVIKSPEHMEKAAKANLPIKFMDGDQFKAYIDQQTKYVNEVVPTLDLEQ